ncbi:MAG: magnesium transporter MgtE N-terminal domain-containing protein [Solirubrobacteraceae bacterium]
MVAAPASVVHVSALAGSPLLDAAGERLGRIDDVVAQLNADGIATVVGLVARIGGRRMFVPIDRVEELGADGARISTTKLNLAQFERRPGEVLLRSDVLDRAMINVVTARLVTAREVEVVNEGGTWRVAGIDPSLRPRLWRLLPRRFRGHDSEHRQFISWSDLEPFVGHVPTSRLKLAGQRLLRLHPAQIADLVEAASHTEGEEILEAVRHDKELEADVFEELDDQHRVEFLRDRPDQQVAAVLERMASDDAVDLLLELEQDRRLPVLNLVEPGKQAKMKGLLGFNPATAGGLMNPDFIALAATSTVEQAIASVRGSELGERQLAYVCLTDDQGLLAGTVSLAQIVRARGEQPLSELLDGITPSVHAAVDLPEVATLMADYNLFLLPVVDGDGRPLGVIAVDDVLALVVPDAWRRRAGPARS